MGPDRAARSQRSIRRRRLGVCGGSRRGGASPRRATHRRRSPGTASPPRFAPRHRRGSSASSSRLRTTSTRSRSISVYDALPVGQIFDGLVALDPGLQHRPGARRHVDDLERRPRSTRFHLREGVRFHDGTPLTSADVVFSLKRLLDPARAEEEHRRVVPPGRRRRAGVQRRTLARAAGRRGARPAPRARSGSRVRTCRSSKCSRWTTCASFPEKPSTAMGEAAFQPRAGRHRAVPLRARGRTPSCGSTPIRAISAARRTWTGSSSSFHAPTSTMPATPRFSRGETEMVEPTSGHAASLLADPTIEVHRYQDLSLSFMGMNTGDPAARRRCACGARSPTPSTASRSPADLAATRREAQGILPPGLPSYSPRPRRSRSTPKPRAACCARGRPPRRSRASPDPVLHGAVRQHARSARAIEQLRQQPRRGRDHARDPRGELARAQREDRGPRRAVVPARLGRGPPRSRLVPADAVRAGRLGELLRFPRRRDRRGRWSAAPRRRTRSSAPASTARSRRRSSTRRPLVPLVSLDRHDRVAAHRPRTEVRARWGSARSAFEHVWIDADGSDR